MTEICAGHFSKHIPFHITSDFVFFCGQSSNTGRTLIVTEMLPHHRLGLLPELECRDLELGLVAPPVQNLRPRSLSALYVLRSITDFH